MRWKLGLFIYHKKERELGLCIIDSIKWKTIFNHCLFEPKKEPKTKVIDEFINSKSIKSSTCITLKRKKKTVGDIYMLCLFWY